MKIYTLAAFAACLCMLGSASASAQQDPNDKQSYISGGIGYYDVLDNDGAADFRLEYRPDSELIWKFKPWVGTEITSEGSTWTGGGIVFDAMVDDNIYIAPSFGAGLYTQGGSDKDLGSAIEFRSQLEGGYQFDNGHRVGAAFGHISNASIGDDNPGTEILNVYYHVPVNDLW